MSTQTTKENDVNSPLETIAYTLRDEGTINDFCAFADDCGEATLLRINFADGTYVVAGIESDEDGEPEGYTWTAYDVIDGDDVAMNTGGGTDWEMFAKDMRTFAGIAQ